MNTVTTNRNLNIIYCKIETIVVILIFLFFGKRYSCLVSHMIMFAKHVCESMGGLTCSLPGPAYLYKVARSIMLAKANMCDVM